MEPKIQVKIFQPKRRPLPPPDPEKQARAEEAARLLAERDAVAHVARLGLKLGEPALTALAGAGVRVSEALPEIARTGGAASAWVFSSLARLGRPPFDAARAGMPLLLSAALGAGNASACEALLPACLPSDMLSEPADGGFSPLASAFSSAGRDPKHYPRGLLTSAVAAAGPVPPRHAAVCLNALCLGLPVVKVLGVDDGRLVDAVVSEAVSLLAPMCLSADFPWGDNQDNPSLLRSRRAEKIRACGFSDAEPETRRTTSHPDSPARALTALHAVLSAPAEPHDRFRAAKPGHFPPELLAPSAEALASAADTPDPMGRGAMAWAVSDFPAHSAISIIRFLSGAGVRVTPEGSGPNPFDLTFRLGAAAGDASMLEVLRLLVGTAGPGAFPASPAASARMLGSALQVFRKPSEPYPQDSVPWSSFSSFAEMLLPMLSGTAASALSAAHSKAAEVRLRQGGARHYTEEFSAVLSSLHIASVSAGDEPCVPSKPAARSRI